MKGIYSRVILPLVFIMNFSLTAQTQPLDEFAIELPADSPHQYVFSNKIAAFWFGETQRQNLPSHQGYTILEQRYLKDFSLSRSEKIVPLNQAKTITLYPDRLERDYGDFSETVFFLDSLNAFLVEIKANKFIDIRFAPIFDGILTGRGWRWDKERQAAITSLDNLPEDKPSRIAVAAWGTFKKITPQIESSTSDNGEPPELQGLAAEGLQQAFFAVIFDFKESSLLPTLDKLRNRTDVYLAKRPQRLQNLLNKAAFKTPDPLVNRAYGWALFSMDDLVTRQRGEGIWAGLPWFNNYWGRDSFISLPGALLCTGQFEEAREVLMSFSNFQNQDENSSDYGRIPNRVMLNEIIYNTTDGAPWFVRACEKYVQYSGDTAFVRQIFPVIQRAMAGALKNHVDEYGFLTHGDAETWMDAVGTEGPWSPRGNRAVEIQVLWWEQIRVAIRWAERLGHQEQADDWRLLENRLRMNFRFYFWDSKNHRLVDHLMSDNSKDPQIRPNTAFALSLPESDLPKNQSLLDESQKEAILKELTSHLLYPWGVASLSQDDPNFHPYHHYPPYYVPDAAYHNGIIWTWLNGPVISALSPYNAELGLMFLREASRQIVEDDAVGNYSELLEAWPRKGSDQILISGTVSQAWNLAEYIRNWHEDMLGIKPDLVQNTIYFSPLLPVDAYPVEFLAGVGNDVLSGKYSRDGEHLYFELWNKESLPDLSIAAKIPFGNRWIKFDWPWKGNEKLLIDIQPEGNSFKVKVNNKTVPNIATENRELLPELTFVEPKMDFTINALRGPQYELISPEEATAIHHPMAQIVFDVDDPAKDDKGPNGRYTYPTNPNFKEGIFDGRRVHIWMDKDYFYFEIEYRNLVDPGWKPEPGYQLTYTAITLNFEKMIGVRRTGIDMNANHTVPVDYGYNFIIYVGNGYRIADAKGEVVAEYRPSDTEHPIGFPGEKKVRFSVPIRYLADRHLRNAVVLIGGQDDHGGGGVGEFRDVLKTAGEWHGGGGDRDTGNPNVYDVIYLRR